jgi:hypothetical protein
MAFGFLLWPIYRIVRKAGFSVGFACTLLAVCAGITLIGRVANLVLTVTNAAGSGQSADSMVNMLLLQHLFDLVLSSSVLGLIPVLYFSFRRWPSQKEERALAKSS